ncbi:hypothetical protein ABE196_18670 [Bacillus subtilis]
MFKSTENINLRKNRSWKYFLIMTLTLIGLVFFLCSKALIHDESSILQTPLNKNIPLATNGNLVINKWDYNAKDHRMEIQLQFKDFDLESEKDITFSALEQINQNEELPTKIMYHDGEHYIVQIEHIHPEFGAIALDVIRHSNEEDELDQASLSNAAANDNEESQDKNTDKTVEATLYTDQRKVDKNDNLKVKSKDEYALSVVSTEKTEALNEIKNAEVLIRKIDKKIEETRQTISSLESDLKYQTETDKAETTSKISVKKDEISSLQENRSASELEIKNQKDKITKLEQKAKDIEGE